MRGELRKMAVFDLDGTLADTWADTRHAMQLYLSGAGMSPLIVDQLGPEAVGMTAAQLLASCGLAAGELEVSQFREHLSAVTGSYLRVADGTPDLLAALKSTGWHLGVATNKPDALAARVLGVSGLAHWFDAVHGGTTCALKPDPEQIFKCLGGIPTTRAVMVGDSQADALSAVAADLACCFWVGGPRDHDLGARVRVVASIADLSTARLEECLEVRRLRTHG